MVGSREVIYFAPLIYIIFRIASMTMSSSEFTLMGIESKITFSRDSHHNIAQEQGPDPHSRTPGEEEHLDHSHMVELGHTHMQVVGVGRHLAEDTVQLEEPEDLDATGVVAHIYLEG